MPKKIVQDFKLRNKKVIVRARENKPRPKFAIWIVAILAVVFLMFTLSSLFSGAIVTVTPRAKSFDLKENFTAGKSGAGLLLFEIVIVDGEKTKQLAAAESKEAARKAKGKVIIYNAYGPDSQRLLIDTRLEAPNGKIYKTDSAVVVPGMKTVNGQSVPGSVEVGIYADAAGENYNAGLIDFTIAGFKGSTKYEKFYARSKTEISGGLKGLVYVLPDEEVKSVRESLRSDLTAELRSEINLQVPDNYVVFKEAVFFEFEEPAGEPESGENLVPVKEKGTAYAVLFDRVELTKEIARKVVEQYDDTTVTIGNLENLIFSMAEPNLDPRKVQRFSFSLEGGVKIVWGLDESKLIQDLMGERKRNFEIILKNYPYIDKAEAVVRPFWRSVFPDEPENLKIVNTYADN